MVLRRHSKEFFESLFLFWVISKQFFECEFVLVSTHNQSIIGIEIDRLSFSLFVAVCFDSL